MRSGSREMGRDIWMLMGDGVVSVRSVSFFSSCSTPSFLFLLLFHLHASLKPSPTYLHSRATPALACDKERVRDAFPEHVRRYLRFLL
jgi:hypothetical protein